MGLEGVSMMVGKLGGTFFTEDWAGMGFDEDVNTVCV